MHIFQRLIGVLLIFASLLGLVVGVSGLVVLWQAEPTAADSIIETVDLFDRTLSATSSLLEVANDSLDQVDENIALIEASVEDVSETMNETAAATDTLAGMMGDDFTDIILETQASLVSVQNSARLIDETLQVISLIPGLGAGYNRDDPLEDSIGEVSRSLNTLPASMAEIQISMEGAADNFRTLEQDVRDLAGTIGDIERNLSAADNVMGEYQAIVVDTQTRLEVMRQRIPDVVRVSVWAATAFLVWFLIAQLGLFTQGVELLSRRDA
jgi:methyl-accepting chemotaxis protein